MPGIAQVIKYEGDNSTFVWKHPCEDFNTQTQLIVHESQQAVFYMNGQLLDVFEAGDTHSKHKIFRLSGNFLTSRLITKRRSTARFIL